MITAVNVWYHFHDAIIGTAIFFSVASILYTFQIESVEQAKYNAYEIGNILSELIFKKTNI